MKNLKLAIIIQLIYILTISISFGSILILPQFIGFYIFILLPPTLTLIYIILSYKRNQDLVYIIQKSNQAKKLDKGKIFINAIFINPVITYLVIGWLYILIGIQPLFLPHGTYQFEIITSPVMPILGLYILKFIFDIYYEKKNS